MSVKKARTNINLVGVSTVSTGGGAASPLEIKRGGKKPNLRRIKTTMKNKAAAKAAAEKAKIAEKQKEKGDKPKSAPTFEDWLGNIGKGKFSGPHEALSAYQKEFGANIPGAGVGAGGKAGQAGSGTGQGGKAGKAGSGTGKHSAISEHAQNLKPKKEEEKAKKKG